MVIATLADIMAILTLHCPQFTMPRALGAPRLAFTAVAGAVLGLLLGAGAAIGVAPDRA